MRRLHHHGVFILSRKTVPWSGDAALRGTYRCRPAGAGTVSLRAARISTTPGPDAGLAVTLLASRPAAEGGSVASHLCCRCAAGACMRGERAAPHAAATMRGDRPGPATYACSGAQTAQGDVRCALAQCSSSEHACTCACMQARACARSRSCIACDIGFLVPPASQSTSSRQGSAAAAGVGGLRRRGGGAWRVPYPACSAPIAAASVLHRPPCPHQVSFGLCLSRFYGSFNGFGGWSTLVRHEITGPRSQHSSLIWMLDFHIQLKKDTSRVFVRPHNACRGRWRLGAGARGADGRRSCTGALAACCTD